MNAPLLLLVGLLLTQATPSSAGANDDLLESAKLGDLARVKQLMASGASVSAVDRRGFTPLMWASVSGSVAVANLLLESGAAVDARSNDGLTALMLASANGFTDVTRALILRGADVNAARNGVKARQFAVERGHTDIAALLDEAEGLGRKLLRAAAEGNDTGVRQLLASGAPVNVTDDRGITALMMAARNGNLGMMQALLSRGADAAVRDAQGQGVYEWAELSAITSKYVVAFLARSRPRTRDAAPDDSRRIAAGESEPGSARRPHVADSARIGAAASGAATRGCRPPATPGAVGEMARRFARGLSRQSLGRREGAGRRSDRRQRRGSRRHDCSPSPRISRSSSNIAIGAAESSEGPSPFGCER